MGVVINAFTPSIKTLIMLLCLKRLKKKLTIFLSVIQGCFLLIYLPYPCFFRVFFIVNKTTNHQANSLSFFSQVSGLDEPYDLILMRDAPWKLRLFSSDWIKPFMVSSCFSRDLVAGDDGRSVERRSNPAAWPREAVCASGCALGEVRRFCLLFLIACAKQEIREAWNSISNLENWFFLELCFFLLCFILPLEAGLRLALSAISLQ